MFSTEDIIAMKVQAILGRGRKKDFWDIAELLKHFTVSDFIQFHKEKFSTQNLMITVPQAITYFADAEESEDPISMKGQTWQSVRQFINGKVRDYLIWLIVKLYCMLSPTELHRYSRQILLPGFDKDGQEKYSTEVVLQGFNGTLTMLDSKRDGGSSYEGSSGGYNQQSQSAPAAGAPKAELMDDEIPF